MSSPSREMPKRLVGIRCLGLAAAKQREKMCHFLLVCLSMWLQSWFFNCCRWESTVSLWVWEWPWGAQWGAVTSVSHHGARGAVLLEKLLGLRPGPGFGACGPMGHTWLCSSRERRLGQSFIRGMRFVSVKMIPHAVFLLLSQATGCWRNIVCLPP